MSSGSRRSQSVDIDLDHGNIVVSRSDGRGHDLSVLAAHASDYLEKTAADIRSVNSDGDLVHAPETGQIMINRSDGGSHDIKIMRTKSDVGVAKTNRFTETLRSVSRRFSGKEQPKSNPDSPESTPALPRSSCTSSKQYIPGNVRIVHLSDTFNLLERRYSSSQFMPDGDIMIHSGNFTKSGTDEEFRLFDEWLGLVSSKYLYRVVVFGDKEVRQSKGDFASLANKLPHATHVLCNSEATILGLKIFGLPWYWGHSFNYTFKAEAPPTYTMFAEIPDGIDILVTHGPAQGRLDRRRSSDNTKHDHCGSAELAEAIRRARPGLHLHGHTTDDRGIFDAYHDIPLTVNSSMCDRHGTVLYSCPFVVVAHRLFSSIVPSPEVFGRSAAELAAAGINTSTSQSGNATSSARMSFSSSSGSVLWDFQIGSLIPT